MRLSLSPPFPVLSAGFVVARLFSSSLIASSQWSIASAFAPSSKVEFRSLPRKVVRNNVQTLHINQNYKRQWIHSSIAPPIIWSRTTALCDSSVDFASTGIAYDISVLQFINEQDANSIDALVQERSKARWEGNYKVADDLKTQILNFSGIPSGYELVLRDIPRNEGGGSQWNLVHTQEIYDDEIMKGSSILQLAHAAMGLAVQDNQQSMQTRKGRSFKQTSLEALATKAKRRLKILQEETEKMDQINSVFEVSTKNTMVQSELGGRTAADAALWFAFAGSKDSELLDALANIASWELQRFGKRPSFQKKYTLQIAERFAAAGLRHHAKLEQVVSACLSEKKQEEIIDSDGTKETSLENESNILPTYLDLHSDRSLLLIWKLATKQKKQRAFLRSAKENWDQFQEGEMQEETIGETILNAHNDDDGDGAKVSYVWNELFQDASRPLVVDVGCGMGVSLLGLASTNDQLPDSKESARLLLDEDLDWSDCNFAGVDLGALGIDYARGVAHRWGMEENKRLHFAIDAAENFCRHLESYPGEVRCCMIQFPTPFRLQNKDTGNSQLPASQLEGFMVTQNLLEIIRSSLHPTKGKLLLQSNCEDVAVWMRNMASQKAGFAIVEDEDSSDDSSPSSNDSTIPQRLPQRTADWIKMGGGRAEGPGWYQRQVLHRKGATETEVSCAINGTPVHRCILTVGDDEAESI